MCPQNVTWAAVASMLRAASDVPLHIVPSSGVRCFGMHVQAIVFLPRQRQLRQKTPLRGAEPAARPFDRRLRRGVHALGRGTDGVVVVTDDGDGAVLDQAHHGIDRPFRIGAIADDIAEADDPLRTMRPREIEAGAERLPVGMDIRKDGKPHIFLRVHHRARAGACLDGYQTPGRL